MRNPAQTQTFMFYVTGVLVCFLFTLHFLPKLQTTHTRTVHPGTEHNPSSYRYFYDKYIEDYQPTSSDKSIFLGNFCNDMQKLI
jgi:hypothetical protein